jgi:hypothetical protein
MSAGSDWGLSDFQQELTQSSQPNSPAVQRSLDNRSHLGGGGGGAVTHSAGTGINILKMVGNFKNGTSLFFSSKMHITKVTKVGSGGRITGTLTIPWIVSNATVRGEIDKYGRFNIRFSEMTKPADDRVNGYYKGVMAKNGSYLAGTFKWYSGTDLHTGSAAYKAIYKRI